jgi:predicted permease
MRDWKKYIREQLCLRDIDGASENEIVLELAGQLEDRYREARDRGAGPEEADAAARALVGDWDELADGILRAKRGVAAERLTQRVESTEIAIRARGGVWVAMADLVNEARTTVRRLWRAPLFSAVVVLTIGVGIGANTAIFSLVKGILLDPLPYDEPDRLVAVLASAPGQGEDILAQAPALHFTYEDDAELFEGFGLTRVIGVDVKVGEEPIRLTAAAVTAGTLQTLGVTPALGRLFAGADDTPDSPATVILSHSYWISQLGGDPGIIGSSLDIGRGTWEVIGVLPRGFRLPESDPSLYLPFRFDRSTLKVGNFTFTSFARLRPGVTIEEATADLARLLPVAVEKFPGGLTLKFLEEAKARPLLRPLKEMIVGDVGDVLWILLGTVGIILLAACADVANLILLRAEGRERELAVRRAMGAGRYQIAAQLLIESVLLGLLGGVVGLLLAVGGLELLVAMAPADIPRLHAVAIDSGVVLFAACLSVLSGAFFGMFPVLRWRRVALANVLKEASRGGGSGRQRHRVREVLVVGQISLALVLLIGAGLMVRSFQAIRSADPGFQSPEEVVILSLTIPSSEAPEAEDVVRAHELISHRLAQVSGVTSVGLTSSVTMDGGGGFDPIHVEDFPLPEGQIPPIRRFKWVGAGYFETMGNQIVAGRTLTWADIHERGRVVLVTENFARELWGDPGSAVGKRIGTGQSPGNWREIIGVVGDVWDDGVALDPVATVYWPMVVEDFWAEFGDGKPFVARSMRHVVRSPRAGTPDFLADLKQAVRSIRPNESLTRVRMLDDFLRGSMARTSFVLVMLAIAAAVALLLATVGVSGAISYAVSRRRREIGVRIALGARPLVVIGMVLKQGIVLAAIGVTLGLAAACWLTRLMTGLLVGVTALDLATYGTVALALTAVALLASYIPARKAAGLDPVETLRVE